MSGCIFCDILAGRAPASFVHRDEHIAAFMDIRPVRAGQIVVIPHEHIDHFSDLSDESATRVLRFGQRLARALRRSPLELKRVGFLVHGFAIPHAHLNVIPLHRAADLTSAQNAYLDDGQIRFRWEQLPLVARDELDRTAALIAAALMA